MKKRFSPELVIARFIKSATNGRILPVKLRRILTVIIIPIWLLGLLLVTYQVIGAVSTINEVEEINANIESFAFPRGLTSQDPQWSLYSDRLTHLEIEKRRLDAIIFNGFASFFYYIFLCFLLPWILLRITFWIIDADKVKEEPI